MKYPQTAMIKLTSDSCLFMCYVYCCGLEPDNLISWLDYFKRALENKLIDEESTVLDAEKLLERLTGKKYSVTKKTITSISDIKNCTPVRYKAAGYTPHWVVVENGKIVFDPYYNSKSVKYGKPIDSRVITLLGK